MIFREESLQAEKKTATENMAPTDLDAHDVLLHSLVSAACGEYTLRSMSAYARLKLFPSGRGSRSTNRPCHLQIRDNLSFLPLLAKATVAESMVALGMRRREE